MTREVPLIHPGEILRKDWLEPLGISQYALDKGWCKIFCVNSNQ